MKIVVENFFFSHTEIEVLLENKTLFITFIHGPSVLEPRSLFWENLKSLKQLGEWCIIRDYNEYEEGWEKWGLPLKKLSSRDSFKNMIYSCDIQDLGSSGVTFTWSNKSEFKSLAKSKLDKAYANFQWLSSYPHSQVFAKPIQLSEHNVIIMNTSPSFVATKKPFKFKSSWFE